MFSNVVLVFDLPMTIIYFICQILNISCLNVNLIACLKQFFSNFVANFKYYRTLVTLLRIEILRHIVLNTPTRNDTRQNSCDSRVEVGGKMYFQSRKIGTALGQCKFSVFYVNLLCLNCTGFMQVNVDSRVYMYTYICNIISMTFFIILPLYSDQIYFTAYYLLN